MNLFLILPLAPVQSEIIGSVPAENLSGWPASNENATVFGIKGSRPATWYNKTVCFDYRVDTLYSHFIRADGVWKIALDGKTIGQYLAGDFYTPTARLDFNLNPGRHTLEIEFNQTHPTHRVGSQAIWFNAFEGE